MQMVHFLPLKKNTKDEIPHFAPGLVMFLPLPQMDLFVGLVLFILAVYAAWWVQEIVGIRNKPEHWGQNIRTCP